MILDDLLMVRNRFTEGRSLGASHCVTLWDLLDGLPPARRAALERVLPNAHPGATDDELLALLDAAIYQVYPTKHF